MRKRFVLGLLTVMLFIAALCARAEGAADPRAYVIDTDDLTLLVDGSGEVILEGSGADSLFAVQEDALYAMGTVDDYRLYDLQGKQLATQSFSMIDAMGEILIFRQGEHFGAMDAEGKLLIAPEWTQIVNNGAGGYLAIDAETADDRVDEIYYVLPGTPATPTGSYTASPLSAPQGDRMPVMDADGRFGAVNAAGKLVIPCAFSWMGEYRDGAAIAAQDGLYGLLDADGTWIVDPVYSWMRRGDACIAALTPEGNVDVLSIDGAVLYSISTPASQAAVVGTSVVLWNEDSARIYDQQGKRVFETSPDALFMPGLDGQIIVSEGPWGSAGQYLVNMDGSVVEGRYQRLLPLSGGRYACMAMQGVEYYSEVLDGIQVTWDYESVRYGLLDGNGQVLLPTEYLEIRAVGPDRLLLEREGEIVFADMDGNALRSWQVNSTKASFEADG